MDALGGDDRHERPLLPSPSIGAGRGSGTRRADARERPRPSNRTLATCGVGAFTGVVGGSKSLPIAVSSGGQVLAVGAGDGVNFFDTSALQSTRLPHPPSFHGSRVTCIRFVPSSSEPRLRLARANVSGNTIAVGHESGSVRCWSVSNATNKGAAPSPGSSEGRLASPGGAPGSPADASGSLSLRRGSAVGTSTGGDGVTQSGDGGAGAVKAAVKELAWFICECPMEEKDTGGADEGQDKMVLRLLAAHAGGLLVGYDTSSACAQLGNQDCAVENEVWRHKIGEEISQICVNETDRRQACVVTEAGSLIILSLASIRDGSITDGHQSTQYRVGKAGDGKKMRVRFASKLRDLLYVMLPRELLCFDIKYGKPLISTLLPQKMRDFVDIIDERNNNLLYCTHTCGTLSLWRRKSRTQEFACVWAEMLMVATPSGTVPSLLGLVSIPDLKNYPSDVDSGGNSRLTCMAGVSSDGRICKWSMEEPFIPSDCGHDAHGEPLALQTPVMTLCADMMIAADATVYHVHPALASDCHGGGAHPSSGLVAVGTNTGKVQVIFLLTSAVVATHQVHSSAVTDITWLGRDRVCSVSCTEISKASSDTGQRFKNEVIVTNLANGDSTVLKDKLENQPIGNVKGAPSGNLVLIRGLEVIEFWITPENATPTLRRRLDIRTTTVEWFMPSASDARAHSSDSQEQYTDRLALVLGDGSLGVVHYNSTSGKLKDGHPARPLELWDGEPWGLNAVSLCARGSHVLLGDNFGNIRMWNVDDGACLYLQVSGRNVPANTPVKSVQLSPLLGVEGSIVAALIGERDVGVYSLKLRKRIWPTRSIGQNKKDAFDAIGFAVASISWVVLPDHHDGIRLKDRAKLLIKAKDGSLHLFNVLEDDSLPRKKSLTRRRSDGGTLLQPCIGLGDNIPAYRAPHLIPEAYCTLLRMMLFLGAPIDVLRTDDSATVDGQSDSSLELLETMVERWISPEVDLWKGTILGAYKRCKQSIRDRFVEPLQPLYPDYASALRDRRVDLRLRLMAVLSGSTHEMEFWTNLPEQVLKTRELLQELHLESTADGEPAPPLASQRKSMQSPALIQTSSSGVSSISEASGGDIQGGLWDPSNVARESHDWLEWRSRSTHAAHGDDDYRFENLVMDHVSLTDTSSAVSILLSSPSDDQSFYRNILRAVALAAASSPLLHARALRVAADKMFDSNDYLGAVQLLYVAGDFEQASKILESKGMWEEAATMAAGKLSRKQQGKFMQRYGSHSWRVEGDLWKCAALFVAGGDVWSCARIFCISGMPEVAAGLCMMCEEGGLALGDDLCEEVRASLVGYLDELLPEVLAM